jgi:predicted ATPase
MDRLIEIDGPRVMVIDDLHWLDQSSAGIFEELVGLTDALPLALLVGGRPGSWPATLDRSRLIRISLEGLDVAETGELARSVAGVAVQPDDILRLHARTGGNPLFIGETVRAIVDDGAITADGRLALGGPGHQPVPATLRALLGSRIDALTPESRAVLRVASVLGMSFHEDVVDDVLAEHVDAARYERLAEAAMIVPIDASGGWRFCHPLIHDAAYAGLLATDRKALHTRVADRMEAGARTGAIGAIARHRAEAGDAVRAVPALIRAAESAVALGARAEAAAYLEMAIGLEGDGPARSALERRLGEIRSLADALAPGATGLDAPVPARAAGVGHGAGVLAEPGQGGRGGGLPG